MQPKDNTDKVKEDTKYIDTVEVDIAGKKVVFGLIDAKGRHMNQVQQILADDPSRYFSSFAHVCVRRVSDNKKLPLEYYEDMSATEYLKIGAMLNKAGFTQ